MSSKEKFLAEIERFLRRHDMTAGRLGLNVVNDNKFVVRLRKGQGTTLDTADKFRAYMREYEGNARRQRAENRAA